MHLRSITTQGISKADISNVQHSYYSEFGSRSATHLNGQPHLDKIEQKKTDNETVLKRKISSKVTDKTILSKKIRLDSTQGSSDKEQQKPIQTAHQKKNGSFQIDEGLPSTMDASSLYSPIISEPATV